MNAARVLATYLQSEQTRSSEQRLASCCNGLIVLIDFMLEVMVFYPKWGELPFVLLVTVPNKLIPLQVMFLVDFAAYYRNFQKVSVLTLANDTSTFLTRSQ